jgi:chemotaxis regulatin CheY-phosphate phosphatase CheZ
MELTKSQVEQVRYQLKKLGASAGNDEIRQAAANYSEFDAVVIAQHIVNGQELAKSTLTVQPVQPVKSSQLGLTVPQKQELVKIQAGFMGIELNQLEIQTIASQADTAIADNIEFLREVKGLIREFLAVRNQNFQSKTSQIVNDIADVINAGEIELSQIVTQTNDRLNSIVNQCKEVATDYKSDYKSRLQGMRESLKLSA